jgi:hypothetical protein
MILIIYIVISLTEQLVRIATFNVNGVNGLLPVLARAAALARSDKAGHRVSPGAEDATRKLP